MESFNLGGYCCLSSILSLGVSWYVSLWPWESNTSSTRMLHKSVLWSHICSEKAVMAEENPKTSLKGLDENIGLVWTNQRFWQISSLGWVTGVQSGVFYLLQATCRIFQSLVESMSGGQVGWQCAFVESLMRHLSKGCDSPMSPLCSPFLPYSPLLSPDSWDLWRHCMHIVQRHVCGQNAYTYKVIK